MALYSLRDAHSSFSDRILLLNIESIRIGPGRTRRIFSPQEQQKLAESILQQGLIQPITVRRCANGYMLVAGERRLRACRMAGLRQIRAIVLQAGEREAALMALAENLQRQELHYFEEANAYSGLITRWGYTQKELAEKLGLTQPAISNKLRLLRLSPALQEYVLAHGLSERQARALLRLETEQARLSAAEQMVKRELSAAQSEELAETLCVAASRGKNARRDPQVRGLWRDWRLFANSMRSAVEGLRSRGLDADFSLDEGEERIALTITLPKKMLKG